VEGVKNLSAQRHWHQGAKYTSGGVTKEYKVTRWAGRHFEAGGGSHGIHVLAQQLLKGHVREGDGGAVQGRSRNGGCHDRGCGVWSGEGVCDYIIHPGGVYQI
jgi:hypothetical protein